MEATNDKKRDIDSISNDNDNDDVEEVEEVKIVPKKQKNGKKCYPIMITFIDEEGELDYIYHPDGDVNDTTEHLLMRLMESTGDELTAVSNAMFHVLLNVNNKEEQVKFENKSEDWGGLIERFEKHSGMTIEGLKALNSDKRWMHLHYGKMVTATDYGRSPVRSYIVQNIC